MYGSAYWWCSSCVNFFGTWLEGLNRGAEGKRTQGRTSIREPPSSVRCLRRSCPHFSQSDKNPNASCLWHSMPRKKACAKTAKTLSELTPPRGSHKSELAKIIEAWQTAKVHAETKLKVDAVATYQEAMVVLCAEWTSIITTFTRTFAVGTTTVLS